MTVSYKKGSLASRKMKNAYQLNLRWQLETIVLRDVLSGRAPPKASASYAIHNIWRGEILYQILSSSNAGAGTACEVLVFGEN